MARIGRDRQVCECLDSRLESGPSPASLVVSPGKSPPRRGHHNHDQSNAKQCTRVFAPPHSNLCRGLSGQGKVKNNAYMDSQQLGMRRAAKVCLCSLVMSGFISCAISGTEWTGRSGSPVSHNNMQGNNSAMERGSLQVLQGLGFLRRETR